MDLIKGFFDLYESFMGTAARKSEKGYREAAKAYDDSDSESVERYRKMRDAYNIANNAVGTNPGTMARMNGQYGDRDAERTQIEEKIKRENDWKRKKDLENMIRNQQK